ncbi:MAG TPA: hypothetical protein VL359_01030, partial [bacterium]|nr:hypothetical protein [bacterium]
MPRSSCYSRGVADVSSGTADRGFILHAAERTHDGRTEIHLVGRLDSGETFAVVDRKTVPVFFVRAADESAVQSIRDHDLPDGRL